MFVISPPKNDSLQARHRPSTKNYPFSESLNKLCNLFCLNADYPIMLEKAVFPAPTCIWLKGKSIIVDSTPPSPSAECSRISTVLSFLLFYILFAWVSVLLPTHGCFPGFFELPPQLGSCSLVSGPQALLGPCQYHSTSFTVCNPSGSPLKPPDKDFLWIS